MEDTGINSGSMALWDLAKTTVLVRFCQFDTTWSYLGRGTSVEESPPSDWPVVDD